MMIRVIALALGVAVTSFGWAQKKGDIMKYRNPELPTEERVEDLLSRMTLEEKIAQLRCVTSWKTTDPAAMEGVGGIGPILRSRTEREAVAEYNRLQKMLLEKSRLGIPALFHDEALHGLVANGATSFPQAIGLAAMWDRDLMERVAAAIANETRVRGIRQVLSPVVNIARDVRWGRVEETYGEDPYLTSQMGVAFCRAVEKQGVITTPKHYAANIGDGGRDSYPIHFSERLLREVYFPAFKACVQEGGARSVMAAYNALDGLPCSSSKWLLTDILRKEWGFMGFVVSDYGSVAGIMNKHFVAANEKEAAVLAVEAGLDVELPDIYIYGSHLLDAAREGRVSMAAIDESVRRVLRAKFQLGLFENPYLDEKAPPSDTLAHRALALDAARKAIVLLRNEDGLLPLKKTIRSLAVIGPNADTPRLGGYSGFGQQVVTVLEGIRRKVGGSLSVSYAKGCEIGFASLPAIPRENLIPPDAKPGEHGLQGEYFPTIDLSGPPALVRTDPQVNFEWQMGSPDPSIPVERFSVRWRGKLVPPVSGTYKLGASTDDGLRLYLDGKLLIESWFDRGATLDYVTVKLEAGRQYDIRMEYYENSGWAYAALVWDLEKPVDPQIQEAVEAAKASDAAVIVVGIIEGEGYDRATLDLPGAQEKLIRSVAETGTPTVVVLVGGSAITMRNWIESIGAIVAAWYPGEEGGKAVADVLFGDYNPAGRLPITFPQSVGQVPLYYGHKPTGRGDDYTDMSGKPQFPFGHGLSYASFEYANLRLTPASVKQGGRTRVSIDVKNVGRTEGEEVVQLYLRDPIGSVTRPVKELKGFQRMSFKPQETKTVTFDLGPEQLSFLGADLKPVIEPGIIEVMVASSSEDIRARAVLEIVKSTGDE